VVGSHGLLLHAARSRIKTELTAEAVRSRRPGISSFSFLASRPGSAGDHSALFFWEVGAFSHCHDLPLFVLFATLAIFVSHGIAAVTGISLLLALLISFGVVFGIQICLVQIAERYKSKIADRLIGWYLFVCCGAVVTLLVVGAGLLVWQFF
jgi:hypothetical protein